LSIHSGKTPITWYVTNPNETSSEQRSLPPAKKMNLSAVACFVLAWVAFFGSIVTGGMLVFLAVPSILLGLKAKKDAGIKKTGFFNDASMADGGIMISVCTIVLVLTGVLIYFMLQQFSPYTL
jgi:hypothetical protein